ncbi:MAG: hypothetical protein QM758_24780 [Armatimonas sp.]
MGLDIVELILATEKAFDITIRDRDAERLTTVRELALFVARRVERRSGRECLTQRSFQLVRKVLMRLDIPRAAITPQAGLYTLKPVLAHPDVWPLLGKTLGVVEWPALPKDSIWRKRTQETMLPYGLRTPGELARHVATCQLERTSGPWTGEEVLLRVRQIVTDRLEVVSFPDDARFVDDLGAD